LGQAVAICLYELRRDPQAVAKMARGTPASAQEVERISDTLLEALRASEYPKLNTSKSFHAAVRRLVRRFKMAQGDAEFLLGMLRQMVWKMKRGRKTEE
jgi:tRNA/rRNA methyltransferase